MLFEFPPRPTEWARMLCYNKILYHNCSSGTWGCHLYGTIKAVKKLLTLCFGFMLHLPAVAALSDDDMSLTAIMQRLQPEGIVDVQGEQKLQVSQIVDAARPERGGSEIYQSVCVTCHGSGAAGAPIFGNKTAWAPHKAKGMAVLIDHALHGYSYMPPRGSCLDCTDSEIKEAIRYMLSQSS